MMQVFINIAAVLLIVVILETLAFVGIGELFNLLVHKNSKLKEPLSLGCRIFTVFGESSKLARRIKDSSEALEPEFIEAMNRTPLSVAVTIFVIILWCITGIAAYDLKINIALTVTAAAAELVIAVIAGRRLSDKKKNGGTAAEKCMKCKISKLSNYSTIRLRQKTFADIRMPNGSRYKMIPVENFEMREKREKSIDIDMYCVVYYDYLPFAKCVIDPKALPMLRL